MFFQQYYIFPVIPVFYFWVLSSGRAVYVHTCLLFAAYFISAAK